MFHKNVFQILLLKLILDSKYENTTNNSVNSIEGFGNEHFSKMDPCKSDRSDKNLKKVHCRDPVAHLTCIRNLCFYIALIWNTLRLFDKSKSSNNLLKFLHLGTHSNFSSFTKAFRFFFFLNHCFDTVKRNKISKKKFAKI